MTQLNLATSLNVGEVIFSAFQVYKSRFWTFIGTALQANIWFFVPNLFWLPLLALTQPAIIFLLFVFLSPLLANNSSFSYIILGIMAIFMIFLGFFCSAKGLRLQSVISRLAYGELIGQTETKQIAIREVKGFWRFWIAQFYISLELLGFSIFISRIASLFGSDLSFVIIELIISFLVQMWIIAKYFISDVAIALQNITAGESLKYSRELSKKHIFDISLILFITTLITLPAYLIPCMPLLTQLILLWQKSTLTSDFNWYIELIKLITFIALAIIGAMIVHIFTIPLWQSLKAVICHKLVENRPISNI